MQSIQETNTTDFHSFHREIVAKSEPVVIRGAVAEWPAVSLGLESDEQLANYLASTAGSKPITAIVADANDDRRLTYNEALNGFNFERKPYTIDGYISELLQQANSAKPKILAMQGISSADYLPTFIDDNSMPLLNNEVIPRLWIGNQSTVPAHYDSQENIACVVAGRRRFSLFRPEETPNLYIGPLLSTPAGAPTSLVDLNNPDYDRYPKFKSAADNALVAELDPGDAIYIPYLWWHNVESLSSFNVLANYWWGGLPGDAITPYQSLLHSLLSIPSLSIEKRRAWQQLFDFYVFRTEANTLDYLPDNLEDIVTNMPIERKKNLQRLLAKQLML
jgi:ribosomal protein L16 Arg81 hydroxylase